MLIWSSDVWQLFDKFPDADKHEYKREIWYGICCNITNIPWRLCFKYILYVAETATTRHLPSMVY